MMALGISIYHEMSIKTGKNRDLIVQKQLMRENWAFVIQYFSQTGHDQLIPMGKINKQRFLGSPRVEGSNQNGPWNQRTKTMVSLFRDGKEANSK